MSEANIEAKEVSCITKTPMMHPVVDGLSYWPRFISPDGERILTESMSRDTKWVGVTDSAKSRRVIHYGYKYDYTRAMDPIKCDPIPEELAFLTESMTNAIAKASQSDAPVAIVFDQLIINEYQPGQGIAAHIDHPQQFGNLVFCVSLGSGTMVTFTHPDGRVVQQYVAANSAYLMTGDARCIWKHGIDAKKSDMVDGVKVPRGVRYSLTFRTIRK